MADLKTSVKRKLERAVINFNCEQRSTTHNWQSVDIDWKSIDMTVYQTSWSTQASMIRLRTICLDCGCKKSFPAVYMKSILHNKWHWVIRHCESIYQRPSKQVNRCHRRKKNTHEFCLECGEHVKISCLLDHQKEHRLNDRILRNVNIVKKFRNARSRSSLSGVRRNLAIYRLYRYCDLSVPEISKQIDMSTLFVQDIIGYVFSVLCLSDTKCAFRNMLMETVKH